MRRFVFFLAFWTIILRESNGSTVKSGHKALDQLMDEFTAVIDEPNRVLTSAEKLASLISQDYNTKISKTIDQHDTSAFFVQNTFLQSDSRGIQDFIRELKQKIKHIINIVTSLPTSIDQIPDKIQEAISKLNIGVIAKQLNTEINDIIKDGGRFAEKCRPGAEKDLNNIIKSAEETAKNCLISANIEVTSLTNEIKSLFEEATKLLADFNKTIFKCTIDNILHPISFAECVKKVIEEYVTQVFELQAKVGEKVAFITTRSEVILKNVANCINIVQIDFVVKGQGLISKVELCVLTAHQ